MSKWKLAVWQVRSVQIESHGVPYRMIRATCPHCGNSFLVGRSWKHSSGYGTASCPHCFKTGRIPDY